MKTGPESPTTAATQKMPRTLRLGNDIRWLLVWTGMLLVTIIWNMLFLNGPALRRVMIGGANTFAVALSAATLTLLFGWVITLALHAFESKGRRGWYMILTLCLNSIRSIPQIIGILFGYIGISFLVEAQIISNRFVIFTIMSMCMSLVMVNEMVDLMRERINHFVKSDFFNAMRVCGIQERRIINHDILWKNSRIHIFNKLISIFGMAVFLQCSVDFVISVGLSTNVNAVNLPATLGSVLAHIESKQDILAIGYALTHPGYIGDLFFKHLQGLSTAFLIVGSLFSLYHIANGFAERHRL